MKTRLGYYFVTLFSGVAFGSIFYQNIIAQSSEVEWTKIYDYSQTRNNLENTNYFLPQIHFT